MIESAHVFGRHDHLVGVCNRPADLSQAKSVGVLMLTPGMLHHVGPYGLHVTMARQLGENGYLSMRFCLSGIGESLGVGVAGCSIDRAADEVRQAMDWMEDTYGIRHFVTFGLCSGADDSIHAALGDPRIVGTALMDGCGYRTSGYYVRKYLWRLPVKFAYRLLAILDRSCGFQHLLPSSIASIFWPQTPIADALPVGQDIREFPARLQAEEEFQQLVDRGVKMLLLYTGGVSEYFNGRRQFDEMFPRLKHWGNIECHYFPHLDHVARLSEDRASIVDLFVRWIRQWQQPLVQQHTDSSEADRNPQDCKHQPPVKISQPAIVPSPLPTSTQWAAGAGFPATSR